jgi:hypothetical protein
MAKATEPSPAVLVIADSFIGDVGGEQLTFVKGALIEADHPAVRKWPERFVAPNLPYPVKRARIEQATAAPGEQR